MNARRVVAAAQLSAQLRPRLNRGSGGSAARTRCHDAALRETVSCGRATMESSVVAVLDRLGADDPRAAANAIMACFEGMILHRIARRDDTDPRPTFDLLVRAAVG